MPQSIHPIIPDFEPTTRKRFDNTFFGNITISGLKSCLSFSASFPINLIFYPIGKNTLELSFFNPFKRTSKCMYLEMDETIKTRWVKICMSQWVLDHSLLKKQGRRPCKTCHRWKYFYLKQLFHLETIGF